VCIDVYLCSERKSLHYYMGLRLLTCLFLLLSINSTNAQQYLVDSITKELELPMPDSNRALSMMRLAIDYEVVDTAKAYKAYKDAIKFAREKKLFYHLGRTYQNQATLFTTATNYSEARASLDTAIICYLKSDHPKAMLWEGNAYNEIGNILRFQNEFQQAAQYYIKSISAKEKFGLAGNLVYSYCNLSSLFGDMGEHDKQLEYARKGVSVARQGGVGQHIMSAYVVLANCQDMREDYRSAKIAIDSARIYFDEEENVDNIDILFGYHLVLAQVFRKLDQLDSAFYFFDKSFELAKKYNYAYGKAESQVQMGAVALLQKKHTDSEKYLLGGIEAAKAVNNFGILDDAYKYLSDIYAVTGRYKQAYESFQTYKELSDSLLSMESKKNTTELEKKYESEKKDKQINLQVAQLRERRFWNYSLVGAAVILLIISLLFYRNYKQKQKLQEQRIRELEKEQQLTATDAVLKGEEQERARLAKDLHDGLGGMLSGIKYSFQTMKGNLIMTPDNTQAFERSMDMLDSSIKEMRRVAHNMMPEALVKFGLDTALKDFCNDINQSGAIRSTYQSIGLENAAIEQTTAITVYRIVQELMNNTMKHAAAKSAIVQVSKTNGEISITVEDDGKGFDPLVLQLAKGIGWSNIQSRVEYLKGKVDVQSEPGKGTSVHIELNA